MEDVRKQERKKGMFRREELPGRFTVKKLFGQSDKRYDKEYWGRLKRNWKWWKEKQRNGRKTLETIREDKEEIKQKESEIREYTKEDKNKIGNMVDPYHEL